MSTLNNRVKRIFKDNKILKDYFKDSGRRFLRLIPTELKTTVNDLYKTLFGIVEKTNHK